MAHRKGRRAIRAQLEANYHLLIRDLLRERLALMRVVHAVFEGDLEAYYILAVIGLRTTEHKDFAATPWDERCAAGDEAAWPSLTTNISSIAQSTGLAEETVRRKVLALMARGWVAREGNRLSYTPQASRDMAAVREALLNDLAQEHQLLSAVLQNAAADPPKTGT